MDFGKLPRIDGVDFALPTDDPRNDAVLRRARRHGQIRIGAPAWGEPRWIGTVYPEGTRSADYLRLYSRQFQTIELNSTFYGTPTAKTVASWQQQVPESFRFCVKVVGDASHEDAPSKAMAAMRDFGAVIAGLGPALGCCFLQLPPEVGPLQRVRVQDLLQSWPKELPLAVELRHEGWFQHGRLVDRAVQLLEEHGAGTVITDVAGRRDVCHSTLTVPLVVLRVVGHDLAPTDRLRATWWAQRIAQWRRVGLPETYLFAHQPDNVRSPEFATMLADALVEHAGIQTPRWRPVPRQSSLF